MKKTAIELIADERERQIEVEGHTLDHDYDVNPDGELARAASIYALSEDEREAFFVADPWPWNPLWFKPTPNDRIRELVKAGALIVAEIERLQRE